MAKKFPVNPPHPERLCWGCDKYCPADSLMCGNGADRTQHPAELFGEDWQDWGPGKQQDAAADSAPDDTPGALKAGQNQTKPG
jgi:hypothetical protein